MQERTFDTGDIVVNYGFRMGTDPPIVLFHGLMGRWQDWMPLVEELPDLAVYAPDMRGHGHSGRAPDGVYRLRDLVADAARFLTGVAGEPAVLVGHSAGVPAAVEVAARRPESVLGVVVGDLPLDLPYLAEIVASEASMAHYAALRSVAGATRGEVMSSLASLRPDLDDDRRWAMTEALHLLDPRGLDAHAEGRLDRILGDLDGDALLVALSCPVLLVQADPAVGGVMPDAYVARALMLLRSGSHVLLDGIDHELGLDTGDVGPLRDALMVFLASL